MTRCLRKRRRQGLKSGNEVLCGLTERQHQAILRADAGDIGSGQNGSKMVTKEPFCYRLESAVTRCDIRT